jgi:hypothetical protein
MAENVTIADLRDGLLVEYLGSEPDRGDVLGERLRAVGMALYPGHPGRVSDATMQHVRVAWVGLEDEPVSYAVGFSCDESGRYAGLGRLPSPLFERRSEILADALASGRDLSALPPRL